MFFVDSFDAGLDGVARRGSVGARRLARRRSVVQCLCVRPCDGRLCHDGYTSCSVSCSTLPLWAFRRRLWSLILICGLFVFVLFPSVAHAQPSLEISGNPTGMTGNDKGYVVVNTNNQYDAALEVLGLWGTKIQLNQEMFAKLSNAETGGAFYTFASSFFRLGSDGVSYRMYPGWAGNTYYQTLLVDVYGFGNVWGVETNSEDMAAAKRDYNVIRNGGSLGGGSSGVGLSGTAGLFIDNDIGRTGAYWTYDDNRYYLSHVLTDSQLRNGYEKIESLSYTLSLPSSGTDASRIPDDLSGWNCCIFITRDYYTTVNYRAVFYRKDLVTVSTITDPYTGSLFPNTFTSEVGNAGSGEFTVAFYVAGTGTFNPAGVNFASADVTSVGGVRPESSGGYTPPDAGASFRTTVAGPPVVPPNNNWPDDDPVNPSPDPPEVPEPPNDDPVVAPEPPDLPNPVDYPVSDPYTPDPDPPTNPIITYDPDPTGDALDYRPWLNAILKLLRTINTSINDGFYNMDVWLTEHCDHIRKQIHDEALNLGLKLQAAITNGFVSFERWLQSTFTPWFLGSLDAHFMEHLRELEGYLNDLFVWLANELDFTVSGGDFDDSTVVSWLKKIYLQLYQLGNREASDTEQQLGTIDYDSSYGRVSAAYGELGDNLPFCVPDDMSTVLGWFVTAPVTPVFDVPWGFAGGSSSCHVDLSGWDGVAAACRSLFMALFCLELTKYTLHLWRLYRAAFAGVSV